MCLYKRKQKKGKNMCKKLAEIYQREPESFLKNNRIPVDIFQILDENEIELVDVDFDMLPIRWVLNKSDIMGMAYAYKDDLHLYYSSKYNFQSNDNKIIKNISEQIAYKNAEETYEKYKDIIVIEEGVVKNSSEVSFWDIWELSAYVRYYTDSGAEGTSYGLAIEWACHNVLSNVPMFEEQAKTLNFGKTIISDFENHNTIPEIGLPILMSVIEAVTNPIFFIYDIVRSF